MRRFLSALARLLVFVLLFYYITQAGFLTNVVQPVLDWFQDFQQEETISSESTVRTSIPLTPDTASETLDIAGIRAEILSLTNELRADYDAGPVVENPVLEQAADLRAEETAEQFSHTRPNGTEFHTIFEEPGLQYPYFLTGENLAMGTHHLDDIEMAHFLFKGWVDSQGHFENMIEPRYLEIGIGVYYDGEFLYLVQIFGTPF